MKSTIAVGLIFAAMVVGGFVFGKVPQSLSVQQREITERPPVTVKDVGPMVHEGGLKSYKYETLCITATGECRKVWHPALHQKLVTLCHDPTAPGGVVFYSAADRFCRA